LDSVTVLSGPWVHLRGWAIDPDRRTLTLQPATAPMAGAADPRARQVTADEHRREAGGGNRSVRIR
jgi:hypothetical protein